VVRTPLNPFSIYGSTGPTKRELEHEGEIEFVEELRAKVKACLTADEWAYLAPLIVDPPRPRGRPSDPFGGRMAMFYLNRMSEGGTVESAVRATEIEFGVKRSAVFAALKKVRG